MGCFFALGSPRCTLGDGPKRPKPCSRSVHENAYAYHPTAPRSGNFSGPAPGLWAKPLRTAGGIQPGRQRELQLSRGADRRVPHGWRDANPAWRPPLAGQRSHRLSARKSAERTCLSEPERQSRDYFSLVLGEVNAAGSFQLDLLACQQQTLAQCRSGFFIPDLDPAELGESIESSAVGEKAYVLILGSVVVSHRTPMRVRGTFQGFAFRPSEQLVQNTITISNGQFDLPIRPQ